MHKVCKIGLWAGAAGMTFVPGPALAGGADDLRDLVNGRASSGETQLRSRGYEHVETHQAGGILAAHWWNEEEDDCVLVRTSNGRYSAITDASDQDCGHHEGANAAAAVAAVGVGAALIAALASHHDDDEDRDHSGRSQYDRGFSDGLHNATYHNYDRSDAYSSGYQAGVRQRTHNLRHRDDHRGRGGYQASVDVSDLEGDRAAGAMTQLERRGFRQVDNFTSGNTRYSIQWNSGTEQCLQATIADGRIYDIRDIRTHPRCR